MSNEIVPWLFEEEHLIRSIDRDGEPWFVGMDVCHVLGIRDHKQALERLDEDELGRYTVPPQAGDDQAREVIVVSEPGAFRLVFTSRKPVAERFKRWLAHEVLPAIRKTGRYDPTKAEPLILASEDARKESIRVRRQLVTEARQSWGSGAARQLWAYLDLPLVPDMVRPVTPDLFTYTAIPKNASPPP